MRSFAAAVLAGFLLAWAGAGTHILFEEDAHPCECNLSRTAFDCGGCSDRNHHHHHHGHDHATCTTCAFVLTVTSTSHDSVQNGAAGEAARLVDAHPTPRGLIEDNASRGPPLA